MGIEIIMSSKGQVVIPKDVRVALGLEAGAKLTLNRAGRRIILETSPEPRERISYEQFRRRVPKYEGPSVAIKDMTVDLDGLRRWREQNGG